MKQGGSTLCVLFSAFAFLPATAEEACKITQLKNPAPTLAEIYAMADTWAKTWKADVEPEYRNANVTFIVDANTGVVEKVLKD